jgi:membrane-associated protease RseP (regulator of RpoE activity)
LVHEFGHYIAGRIHGVNMSLPYFIPAPTLIGTMGAVIKSRSAFINRKQLLDVGAAGPLAGLVVSIIVFAVGVYHSPIREMPENVNGLMMVGDSLLNSFMVTIIKGPVPDNYTLIFNSVAFAGWVGLLVTMLNLLPIGHLDGGHIVYALIGKKQRHIASLILIGLLILSFYWTGWIFWIIFGILLRPAHPPTLLDEIPLGKGRIFVGYLSLAVFVLCFMPVPFSIT